MSFIMGHKHSEESGIKKILPFIIVCLIVIIGLGIYFGWKYMNMSSDDVYVEVSNIEDVSVTEKEIGIFSGIDRPVACMIDNSSEAWPQFSLNDAYIVYEIIVEGEETRLMALFKNNEPERVGPMRSSRHYFLDYALENDAIYAHIGWSPQAQSDIKTLGVNNINGLEYDTGKAWTEGNVFWRISGQYKIPHNSITSVKAIKEEAEKKGYAVTSSKKSVLNYSTDEVVLSDSDSVLAATDVIIPFSSLQTVNFQYDDEAKVYTRYARNKLQTDATTQSSVTTKNIIITFAENYTLQDTENKGRQGLKNIGTKDGYYITNGQAIPITCTKDSRASQTVYADSNGNVIDVNDGNTFIEICPLNTKVSFE